MIAYFIQVALLGFVIGYLITVLELLIMNPTTKFTFMGLIRVPAPRKKTRRERMSEEIERISEGEITCPYCGDEQTDSWERLNDTEDSEEMDCDNEECGKKFSAIRNVETTYTTRGLCDENNTEHNWNYFDHVTDGKRTKGKNCLTCQKYEFDKELML